MFTRPGGHIALMDAQKNTVKCEVHVREAARDVAFLHNESMFAVAQKRCVYVYDDTGMELHCLREHIEPYRLDFLPYHYLLVSVGRPGVVKWQDTRSV